MGITIREALEAIAIISAMIAVIAIPNPAEAVEPRIFVASHTQCRKLGQFQIPAFQIVRNKTYYSVE